jgi:NAD-dependent deacetylase
VIFTGAGVSAESGIKTFRDSDGLWENYRIEDVATPQAWVSNPKQVLDFYNQRRKQVIQAKPNAAHYAVAELQDYCNVTVITQNIDDLHERAGSSKVIHLHGEITKARSEKNIALIQKLSSDEILIGDLTEFADVFIVIGTSLNVYPAANLAYYAPADSLKYVVDPKANSFHLDDDYKVYSTMAGVGVRKVVDELINMIQ